MDLKYGLYNGIGGAVSGSLDLAVRIKRDADDQFFDFNDSAFKAAGHVTMNRVMSEIDAVNVPGEYELFVDIALWDDGQYSIYYEYSGAIVIPFVDSESRWVWDGKESLVYIDVIDDLLDDLIIDVGIVDGKVDTVDGKIDTVGTQVTAVSAQVTTVDGKVDTIGTGVASVLADTSELQGLIDDSKLPTQVKGMDADVVSAAALKADAVAEIVTEVFAKTVDGTYDMAKVLKTLLAISPGKKLVKSGSTYIYYDQGGNAILTVDWTATETTAV